MYQPHYFVPFCPCWTCLMLFCAKASFSARWRLLKAFAQNTKFSGVTTLNVKKRPDSALCKFLLPGYTRSLCAATSEAVPMPIKKLCRTHGVCVKNLPHCFASSKGLPSSKTLLMSDPYTYVIVSKTRRDLKEHSHPRQ